MKIYMSFQKTIQKQYNYKDDSSNEDVMEAGFDTQEEED
jgi:hypothetical protein